MKSLDADKDGTVAEKEISGTIGRMFGPKMADGGPEAAAQSLVRVFDENRNGILETNEALKDPIKFYDGFQKEIDEHVSTAITN